MSRWRPPLRIAWRSARRTPGRTLLVAALVGFPVLAATFVDTALRTSGLSNEVKAARELGRR
jgi:putative ABC transport system permease protein